MRAQKTRLQQTTPKSAATMATVGPNGTPHLVAMWYAVIDGHIWFETKARAQKTVNLRRNSQITCMIEDGLTYDSLRGVSIEGTGEIVGATLVAAHAGEMISELTLAITNKLPMKALAETVHCYPTQAEVLQRIALAYGK